MARVNKSVIGFISGKLGDVVFREMNRKKFVSVSAKKYKISQSAQAKKGRANFAAAVKLAKAVNSVPLLKEIWSTAKIEGTNSYHRIIKYNAKSIVQGNLTTANKITPEGLALTLSSLEVQNNLLHLTINFPFKSNITFPVTLFICFSFNDAIYSLFIQQEKIIVPLPDDIYTLSIALNAEIKKALAGDPHPIIYLALAGLYVKKKVYWTGSIAAQL